MHVPKWIVVIVSLGLLGPLIWVPYAIGKSVGRQEGAARGQVELAAAKVDLEAAHVSVKRLNDEADACGRALNLAHKGDPEALARALGATITPAK